MVDRGAQAAICQLLRMGRLEHQRSQPSRWQNQVHPPLPLNHRTDAHGAGESPARYLLRQMGVRGMKFYALLLGILSFVILPPALAAQDDAEGCKDTPMLTR